MVKCREMSWLYDGIHVTGQLKDSGVNAELAVWELKENSDLFQPAVYKCGSVGGADFSLLTFVVETWGNEDSPNCTPRRQKLLS